MFCSAHLSQLLAVETCKILSVCNNVVFKRMQSFLNWNMLKSCFFCFWKFENYYCKHIDLTVGFNDFCASFRYKNCIFLSDVKFYGGSRTFSATLYIAVFGIRFKREFNLKVASIYSVNYLKIWKFRVASVIVDKIKFF